MEDEERLLEEYLLLLGGQELKLEKQTVQLRSEARAAGQSGYLARADALSETIDQLRAGLAPLQSEIMSLERRLYGLRKRRQRLT